MTENKILVTGAAGFIGSFLCEELLSRGYNVIGVDNFFRGKKENIEKMQKDGNFLFQEMDLDNSENIDLLRSLLQQYHITDIFHLAAINGTQHFYDHPTLVLDQNIKITQVLMSAIANTAVNNLIYTSSSEVYGEPQIVPTPEDHPILLNANAERDSYAASKAIGDYYVRLYAKEKNINFLILRVFNMYGERMVNTRYGQVIPEFIRRMLNKEPFTIIGDGHHTRSFCYIKDATWAMVEFMEKRISGFLNLGNDYEISILELAKTIHSLENQPFNPVFLPERPHDHHRRCPDLSKLKSILPNMKFTDLQSGIKQVINYYKFLQ